MSERRLHQSPYELLQHEHYTAEEAAEALLIGVERVRHAVFTGELPAQVIGHDIVSINREDIVAWFQASADASQRA